MPFTNDIEMGDEA